MEQHSQFLPILLLLLTGVTLAAGDGDSSPSCSFPDMGNAAAGNPSQFWAESITGASRPLPTNAFWLNYVLEEGSQPEYIHPYSIRSKQGTISLCYPARILQPNALLQLHSDDLTISCKEEEGEPLLVSEYDDLSVTLRSRSGGRMAVPLVRGSPYVTFVFSGGTPQIATGDARLLNVTPNSDGTKHRLQLDNGQTWLLYTSSPLDFNSGSEFKPFTGVIRLAVLPDASFESVLDRYSSCYPVSGRVEFPAPFTMLHKYVTNGTSKELLLLHLPLHKDLLVTGIRTPEVSYNSIDGPMQGVVGSTWTLRVRNLNTSWYSIRGLQDPAGAHEIAEAVQRDAEEIPAVIENSSTYFFGKAAARAARLALIAQEVAARHDVVEKVAATLERSLAHWLDNINNNNNNNNQTGAAAHTDAIVYDKVWGGLISRDGATDSGADFGLGIYNDHHFHWGYFVYAGAVLAKLNPAWGAKHRCSLYELMSDYMQLDSGTNGNAARYARLRHFDPWLLHSWAGGLKDFVDGRNQESTSEAVNAYYAASLLGSAFGDEKLAALGRMMVALEAHGAQSLWHVPRGSRLYDAGFVQDNRIVGVLWNNKRDSALWFAPAERKDVRVGIQVLPISPVTEVLFPDVAYNKELVEWAEQAMNGTGSEDGWRGFVYAVQATYDPVRALNSVRQLGEFDDGNSASNLLWWIHTRAPNPEKLK